MRFKLNIKCFKPIQSDQYISNPCIVTSWENYLVETIPCYPTFDPSGSERQGARIARN